MRLAQSLGVLYSHNDTSQDVFHNRGSPVYMCYLDESGVQENTGTSHFVLLGLAVLADQWKTLERQVTACKRNYGLEDAEIHAGWVARRYNSQRVPGFEQLSWQDRRAAASANRRAELIRIAALGNPRRLKMARGDHRKTEPYIHLTFDERFRMMRELADLIASWQDARLFAEVVDKRVAYSNANLQYTPFEFSFTELVQRFEYFLKNRGNFLGCTLNGLLVQDNNQTVARRLTEMMRRFHNQGTRWTGIDHIIETPLFVDSHLTSMVQLADLCSYATRRFFENNETDLFDRIYQRFDRAHGNVLGIRHYGPNQCRCRVCQDHN